MKKIVLSGGFFLLLSLLAILYFEKDPHEPKSLPASEFSKPVKSYSQEVSPEHFDSLRRAFGYKKQLPEGYELQALYALRHYPELRETPIRFYRTDSDISLLSQPNFKSLLLPWRSRSYNVIIDTVKIEDNSWKEPTLLRNIPFNGQVGVLGHELAHIIAYRDKRGLELVWMGLKYLLSPSYREELENATDRRTIEHGLGYQLLVWSQSTRLTKTREGKGRLYLSPVQIRGIMEEYPMYEKNK